MKTSPGKQTYPRPEQIIRIIKNDKIKRDVLVLEKEQGGNNLKGGIPLLVKMFDKGKLVCNIPSLAEIKKCHLQLQQLALIPKVYKSLEFLLFPVGFNKKVEDNNSEI
jgi:hypothetical protein